MKNTDLRLGNLVLHNGKIVKVVGIEEKHVSILKDPFQCYFHTVPIDALKPIPLTEEILVKLGFSSERQGTHYFIFEDIDNNIYGDVFCFNIDRNTDLFNLTKTKSFTYRENGIILNSAHQVQNIFNCFTGKELKYNE